MLRPVPCGLCLCADGLGGVLYSRKSAVQRVQARWPPRATAALDAFLSLSDAGQARGYDGVIRTFHFGVSEEAVYSGRSTARSPSRGAAHSDVLT